MFKLVKILFVVLLLSLTSACTANNTTEQKEVYANSIKFNIQSITREVGEEIEVNTNLISLNPYNAKITRVTTSNADVATFDETKNSVICTNVGTTNITVFAQAKDNEISSSISLNVQPKSVFAKEMIFENDHITLNYNETSVNVAQVVLNDISNTVVLYENYLHKIVNSVSYVNNEDNLITYDVLTGRIVVNKWIDKVKEVTVLVKLKTGLFTNEEIGFKVLVTNYIYAQNIKVLDFNFEDQTHLTEINLFTNTTLNLTYELQPTTSNVHPTFKVNSNAIEIVNNKILTTGEIEGQFKVVVVLNENTEFEISKEFIVNVEKPINNFETIITNLENENVTEVFISEDFMYKLKINFNKRLQFNKIINVLFENTQYYEIVETEIENEFLIRFTKAFENHVSFVMSYSNTSYNETRTGVNSENIIKIYEPISDFDIIVQKNSNEKSLSTEPIMHELTIVSLDHLELANKENINYFANIEVLLNNCLTKENNFEILVLDNNDEFVKVSNFSCENANITQINTNKLIINELQKVGEITLKIVSLDHVGFSKTIMFKINCFNNLSVLFNDKEIEKVKNEEHEFELFLNVHSQNSHLPQFIDLENFTFTPKYAHISQVKFVADEVFVTNEMGKLKPIKTGLGTVVLNYLNSNSVMESKEFKVKVLSGVTGLVLNVSNNTCITNFEKLSLTTSLLNDEFRITFSNNESQNNLTGTYEIVLVNEVLSSKVISYILNEKTNHLAIRTLNYGTQLLTYTFTDGINILYGEIEICVERPYSFITKLEFENSKVTYKVNLDDTNVVEQNKLLLEFGALPFEKHTLVITSSNDDLVKVNESGEIEVLAHVGQNISETVTITATCINELGVFSDYYNIEFYYYPYSDISSVNFTNSKHTYNINLYESNDLQVNNLLLSVFGNKPHNPEHLVVTSSNDKLIKINQHNVAEILVNKMQNVNELVTIKAKTLINNEWVVDEYYVNITFEPYTNLKDVVFENDNITINAYELESNVFTNEIVEIFKSNNANFELEFSVSENNFSSISKTGEIIFNNNVKNLTEPFSLIVTVKEKSPFNFDGFSYTLNVYYEIIYTQITSVEFVGETFIELQSNESKVLEFVLVLNENVPGNFNYRSILVNSENLNVQFNANTLTINTSVNQEGCFNIIILVDNVIFNTINITVTEIVSLNYITNEFELLNCLVNDEEYYLKNDIELTSNFETINEINAKLYGENHSIIYNGFKSVFAKQINENAILSGISFENVQILNYEQIGSQKVFTSIALYNAGTIENVVANVTISTTMNSVIVSGFIYENSETGIVSNVAIIINANAKAGSTKTDASGFMHINKGITLDCDIINGLLLNFSNPNSFAKTNFSTISGSMVVIEIKGQKDMTVSGFVFEVTQLTGFTRKLENIIVNLTINFTNGTPSKTNKIYGFVGMAKATTFINCNTIITNSSVKASLISFIGLPDASNQFFGINLVI